MADNNEEMVTRSIYIKKELYDKFQKSIGTASVSFAVTRLMEKWLNGEVTIEIQLLQEK